MYVMLGQKALAVGVPLPSLSILQLNGEDSKAQEEGGATIWKEAEL